MPASAIHPVGEDDLGGLLALMREYCDFYEVSPPDERLLNMARALIADPAGQGVQLIACSDEGEAVGFATIFWSWSTLGAARHAVMNDLYVAPAARGRGLAEELIAACCERARAHGAASLGWQTAKANLRAQAVYERVGAQREEWLDYGLELVEERDRP